MSKYVIGIDFGTLSGRAVLVNVNTGDEICTSVFEYPHAVMEEQLPCGKKLGQDFALEHPQDYLDVLAHVIPDVLKQSGVDASQIIGVGIDHTACTVLPVKADGTPLCFLDEYKDEPHAYVKLWKHHGGEEQAGVMTRIAISRGEEWLNSYGGTVSAEWALPKMLETLERSPKVYNAAEKYSEIGDWLVSLLTGNERRSACQAGYKSMYQDGYQPEGYLNEVAPFESTLPVSFLSNTFLSETS